MAEAQAGWYPDPAGDVSKLRYWDGEHWTETYTDAQPATTPTQSVSETAAAAAAGAVTAATATTTQQTTTDIAQSGYLQVGSENPQSSHQQQSADFAAQGGYQQAAPQTYVPSAVPQQGVYDMTDSDRSLRLIAFVFCIISMLSTPFFLFVPLAWMIPMTVHAWGVYKGTKPNTVAFGVCTLIFVNLVGGILLLCSKKEK